MLYLLRGLRTTVSFSANEIEKVGDTKEVWSKLKDKVEGKCTNEHGIIVHIPNPELDGGDFDSIMPLARLDNKGGCACEIEFSAISFKAEKNDLIWAKVAEVSPECLSCSIGPVEIKIPKSKMDPQLEYDKSLNCFRMTNKNYRIESGSFIIGKVFESRVHMGTFLQIIAELPANLMTISSNLK